MQREILFRGISKHDGQWREGSLLQWPDGTSYICYPGESDELIKDEVLSETIGQYTGQNDKKGNKVYEHDIIQFAEKFFYEVVYEEAKFVGYHTNKVWGKWGDIYKLNDFGFDKYHHEVIGNIFQHPELLTQPVS